MSEPGSHSSFGDLLRRYRTNAGFSQEELAQRANVSLAAVSALERGTRRAPQRRTLELLLDGLGMSTGERSELLDAASRSRARAHTPHVDDAVLHPETKSNIPLYLTSFVAREADIAELRLLIEESRLVTIVGAGGIGKTRLACELASRLIEPFDRVVFADLAPLIEGEMLAPYLASFFQQEGRDGAHIDVIASVLGHRRVLMILDNCERLLDAAAATASALLRRCPQLTVIATSRERLAVSGEWIYRLAPLDVPRRDDIALVDAEGFASLALFVRRAQSVEPRFKLREDELSDVANICVRLDGIPLAIELAVARLPTLGVRQLLRRLDQQFASSVGFRDAPPRHQTMRATIAWSVDLLDAGERELLSRIGIFVGGFTLEAAEIVCVDDTVPAGNVIALLSSLVEKSLLVVDHAGSAPRYRLLDSVRLYSLERLNDAGILGEISRRHAGWVANEADAADLETRHGIIYRSITLKMVAEVDNIRAALERLLATGEPGDIRLAARIVGGLRTVWTRLSLFEEGVRWTREIFARLDVDRQPELSALVMSLQIQCVPQPLDRGALEHAVRIFTRVGDYYFISRLYENVMWSSAKLGYFDLADYACGEAAKLFASEHALGVTFYALFLCSRSLLLAYQGHYEEAREADAAAAAIPEFENTARLRARRCQVRACIEAFAGNYPEAIALEREMLTSIGDESEMFFAGAHANVAKCCFLNGDYEGATSALRSALAGERAYERLGFCEIVQVAAALAAHRGAMDVAARLKGFYDSELITRRGTYRTPLEIRLNEKIEAALFGRLDLTELRQLKMLGGQMLVEEARTLARSL